MIARRDDVLYAFAVEPLQGRDTLERYLRDHPEYAGDLIDLSYELSRGVHEDGIPLSIEQQSIVDNAWLRHIGGAD